MKNILIIGVLIFALSSCATAPLPDPVVEAGIANAMIACHQSAADIAEARIAKLNEAKDVLLDAAISGLTKAATDGVDPCRLVTNNDLQKIAMEENTKQIVAALDTGKATASSIVTGVIGWKALDTLPSLFGSGKGNTYNLTSSGDMNVSDSLKTSTIGDVSGSNSFGDILSNPVDNTAEPFVFGVE